MTCLFGDVLQHWFNYQSTNFIKLYPFGIQSITYIYKYFAYETDFK